MTNKSEKQKAEFNESEGPAIIDKHWTKTLFTLQKLMNQMNMMYYYEKLKFKLKILLERSQSAEGASKLPNL